MPNRALALTRQMAESLRRVIERMSILDRKSGRRIDHITASFGVGNTSPGDGRHPDRAYRQSCSTRPRSWDAIG